MLVQSNLSKPSARYRATSHRGEGLRATSISQRTPKVGLKEWSRRPCQSESTSRTEFTARVAGSTASAGAGTTSGAFRSAVTVSGAKPSPQTRTTLEFLTSNHQEVRSMVLLLEAMSMNTYEPSAIERANPVVGLAESGLDPIDGRGPELDERDGVRGDLRTNLAHRASARVKTTGQTEERAGESEGQESAHRAKGVSISRRRAHPPIIGPRIRFARKFLHEALHTHR